MRTILLVIHIVAAATWLGASITQLAAAPMLTRGGGQVASAWMSVSVGLSKRLYPIAGVLVLAAGIGLVLMEGGYAFSDVFVGIGIAVVVLGGALGGMVFGPAAEKAQAAFASGDDAGGRAATARIARFGLLDVLLLVFAIFAMVAKW